jgi:methylenetetrahydrofolate dehydrogenase (NADP+)/methenyltetrahydrofolate cyclohydrolase
VKSAINSYADVCGKRPKLVSILAEGSKDAEVYVNMQKKCAESVGIEFDSLKLPLKVKEAQMVEYIRSLNGRQDVSSVILQKPLPEGIDHSKMVSFILPEKDAEGLHPMNLGKIFRQEADILPCTPGAVMKILDHKKVELYGKEVVILGHSVIVGKPLSLMLLNRMATTTVCHIGTADKGTVKEHARRAEVLIVAVGKAGLVKKDWVADGAVVIDVGINKTREGIMGDVCFDEVSEKADMLTPVPGGVGPVTVSILMRNVLRAFAGQNSLPV